uniref:Coiled-coil domain-containing protein 172 n=1 Tax=Podarcis muralis TaxID=64176 RepID=A0A670IFJ7_PODMU
SLLYTFSMGTKKKIAIEDERFLKEITEFNSEYGLTSKRELLIKKRVKAEICELGEKENVLRNGIVSFSDLEEEIREAKNTTKCLETEKNKISEKPQTDPECARLKKKLESYREDEMENACEALQTEIEFLDLGLAVQWYLRLRS